MAENNIYTIQEETLTEIADAIRDQTGETDKMSTSEMPSKIRSIVGTGAPTEAVLYVEQNLNEQQKVTARNNIDVPEVYISSEEPAAYAEEGAIWFNPDGDGYMGNSAITIAQGGTGATDPDTARANLGLGYKIIRDLSGLGLTGTPTTAQVFSAMPNYSIIYITHSSTTISDAPTSYCLMELVKAGNYGFAKATQINTTLPRIYEGSYYNGSGFAGWKQSFTKGTMCMNVSATGTDLNDYTEDGWYFFATSVVPTNIPTGTNGWLQVITQGTLTKQIWYRMGTPDSNDFLTYVRTRNGTTWGAWRRLMTDVLVPNTEYGTTLPAAGTKGRIFFKKV